MSGREIEAIVDFILNRAAPDELNVLKQALDRKMGQMQGGHGLPQNPAEMDFGAMAKNITQDVMQRFNLPDNEQTHQMTRRLVSNMIREQQPGIPQEHLEQLLDQWVPSPAKMQARDESMAAEKENELPTEVLMSMVDQFISFSLGKMPASELNELKKTIPDWTTKYWDFFSTTTKKLIADLLAGKSDLQTFRATFEKHIAVSRGSR